MDRDSLASELDGSIELRRRCYTDPVSFCDTQNAKSPVLQHSGETTATISDHKCFSFVVPVYGNDGIGSVFIVIIVAFVFIQGEIPVRSRVDSNFNRIWFD